MGRGNGDVVRIWVRIPPRELYVGHVGACNAFKRASLLPSSCLQKRVIVASTFL